jgi:MraZ protein
MLLTGTFTRSIDDKLRVAIPKRFRLTMGCPEGGVLYLAPGTDGSLALYSEESFSRLAERLALAPPTRQQVRDFTRMFYGQAQQVEMDGQGRIRVPKYLADLARVQKDVVLLGVQDHLEIWAADRWEVYLAEKQKHYDEIAEAAFAGPRLE